MTDFLAANAVDPDEHTSARAFLTPAARNGWSDVTATIVASGLSVGTYNTKAHTLRVQGRVLGQLNADGIYTPSLQADGQGGPLVPFDFHLSQVDGQYRIDRPRERLLLTDSQFQASFGSASFTSTTLPTSTWYPTCGGVPSPIALSCRPGC